MRGGEAAKRPRSPLFETPVVRGGAPHPTGKEQMSEEYEGRGTSAIQFPYVDLQGAIEVARAVLDAGGVPLDRDQLAAALDMTPGSGAFSVKIAAARQFGLLETQGGKNQLSALGFEILDPARSKAAMATAFLNVPLYRRVYDELGAPAATPPLWVGASVCKTWRGGKAKRPRAKYF